MQRGGDSSEWGDFPRMIFHNCDLARSHLLSWSGLQCESQLLITLVLLHSFTKRCPESIEGQRSDAESQKWLLSLIQVRTGFEERRWNAAHQGGRGPNSSRQNRPEMTFLTCYAEANQTVGRVTDTKWNTAPFVLEQKRRHDTFCCC